MTRSASGVKPNPAQEAMSADIPKQLPLWVRIFRPTEPTNATKDPPQSMRCGGGSLDCEHGQSSVLFNSILRLYLQLQESHGIMANLDSFRGVYKAVDKQDIDVDIYLPQEERHGSSSQYPVSK